MPISRYEIRNEYSLADPDLYRAADKDDPEALLEGVAMAGLVGLLRQLGDLAEFAAEVFHDLHEEVMATAARGHGLMVRVQQLESEVPSIEKAFLSQTDHSSFFYSAGVDWHPNLRMDQNLVTHGDLPRFVMDSYEECRGPPRLFLLDKFDVAGAGACLKRYTDPSFFKIEPPMMTSADVHREKKIRKAKKKGPRWRNGGTPEVIPTSHAKLHQLFLEERVDNGVSKPARRVTLKRRLNGFPFDSRTGKSYMEKLLRSPSPEHKVLHEDTMGLSLAMLPSNGHNESGLEVVEFRSISPERERTGRKRSPPDREEIVSNPSMHKPYENYRDDKSCEVSNSYPRMVSDEISYTIDNMDGERDISVSGDSKMEASLNGYESDGIASEVDNYVDAPSTIGSEIDTDSELRGKSDSASTFFKTQPSYANEDVRTRSSDSKSTGDQTVSDEGINSSKKETSSFCSSGSLNTSAENPPQDKFLAAGLVSADVPDIDLVDDASSSQKSAAEDLPQVLHPNPVVTDYTCTSTDAITIHRSDLEQLPASFLCSSDSITLTHSDSEGSGIKDSIREPELEDKASVSDEEEKKINVVMDQICYPIVLDSASQSGDDYLRFSAGEHVDEELNTMNLPRLYAVSENHSLTDSSDHDNCNLIENTELSLNTCNSPRQNTTDTLENVPSESPKPDKVDEFPELHEECSSDRPDVADNDDNILSIALPAGVKVRDELDDEDSVIFTESYIMKSSPGKDFSEASLVTAHNDVEELYSSYPIENQLSSENLILPYSGYSPDRLEDVTDAHEGDALEDEINENQYSETPESCHVVGLPGLQQTDDLFASHSAALETSRVSSEILEEPLQQFDNMENKCSTSNSIPVLDVEVDQNLASADLTSLNKSACEVEQTENADMDSAAPEVSDHTDRNSSSLLVGGQEVEEHACSTDSDMDELEDGLDSVIISHRHLGLMDGAGREEGTSSVSCNDTDDDHFNIEVPDSVPYQEIDSYKIGSSFDDAATLDVQSGLDGEKENLQQDGSMINVSDASLTLAVQSGLDGEKENLQQDGSMINVSDASSSPPDFSAEELLDSREERLGLSPVLLDYSHEVPDHVDHDEDNSSGSMLSLVNCAGLPSSSELPGVNNRDATVTELPKDPLGSTFPPSNLCETTRINLDELPPLPPLPPVQWRMGKLLQGLSITGGERMRPELFPVAVSPPVAFTDASSSLLEEVDHSLGQITLEIAPGEEKVDHGAYSSLLEKEMNHSLVQIAPEIVPKEERVEHGSSIFAHSSLLEEMNHSLVQTAPEIVPKEERIEHGSSSFDATVMDEMIELQPELEIELLQPTASTNDVCSSPKELNDTLIQTDPEKAPVNKKVELISSSRDASHMVNSPEELNDTLIQTDPETAAVSKKVELISSSQDASHTIKQIDLQPGIDNVHPQVNVSLEDPSPLLQNMNHSTISISPEAASEQEKVQQSSSSEDNTMMLNKVVPRKVENEQLKLLLPFKVRELPLPAEEDGASNEIRPKLPRPRNPLVNDVSALDKSKLRKVTERVRPPIEKVDERDSLLEQIRNKSFNLKPAMVSRPSIRGPRTNLKVAAILEKANQIRQAFAGSDDEEDDDNWSDS